MMDEINHAFDAELQIAKQTSKGYEVTAMKFFSRVAHRSATRVMIGSELCRDEKFLEETIGLLESIFFTAIVIVTLPLGPLRHWLARALTLPHKWRLDRCTNMLRPVVEKRMEARKKTLKTVSEDSIGDGIEWTLDLCTDERSYNTPVKLTHELLHNLWAASSAPGGMMTEIVFQLLSYPQYIKPLRKEAEVAVKENGWTEKMISALHLQDSFIREVNRLLPTGASKYRLYAKNCEIPKSDSFPVTCSRTVVGKPFTFSDGLCLPVGTRFGFPIKAMQSDPAKFSSPEKFDGFRFLRQASGNEDSSEDRSRWSATAMSTTNLAWGYGNHICPGRFFAVRELKFMITKLLLDYEIGWDRRENSERPSCVNVEGQFVPNLSQKVYLKRRII